MTIGIFLNKYTDKISPTDQLIKIHRGFFYGVFFLFCHLSCEYVFAILLKAIFYKIGQTHTNSNGLLRVDSRQHMSTQVDSIVIY